MPLKSEPIFLYKKVFRNLLARSAVILVKIEISIVSLVILYLYSLTSFKNSKFKFTLSLLSSYPFIKIFTLFTISLDISILSVNLKVNSSLQSLHFSHLETFNSEFLSLNSLASVKFE